MSASIRNFYGDSLSLADLKFLFLLCPNNSGTTIMSQYITAQVDGYLPPFGNNEGQMMPAVRDMMRNKPWNADQKFDWGYIRAQWERLVSDKCFVEASPPNLLRVHDMEPVFGRDSTALVSICDPYQHIASSMHRYTGKPRNVAKEWVFKARHVRQIREDYPHLPFVSHEEFVKNPASINEAFGLAYREASLKGKRSSGLTEITSTYFRSIGFLRHDDVVSVTEVLETAADVLEYFGYGLAGPKFLADAQERNPEEFGVGLARRETWEQGQTSSA